MKSNLKSKVIGLVALFFLTIVSVYAQPKFGVRVGANISKQEYSQGNITVEPESKFGLDLAVVADFPLGEVISFGPELHWLQNGYKVEDILVPIPVDELVATLNYLELPLLLKANFGETAKFFVMGGPSVGYLLSGRSEIDNGGAEDIDLDEWNRLEFGAHLGAGVGIGPVVVDVRYLLGISNIANDRPDDAEIRNTGFGAGVSLMF